MYDFLRKFHNLFHEFEKKSIAQETEVGIWRHNLVFFSVNFERRNKKMCRWNLLRIKENENGSLTRYLRGHTILPNYPFCRIFLYLSYTLRILNSDYFLFYILITYLHSLFLKFHNSVTTVIQQFFSSFFRIIFTRHFSTLPSKQYSLLYCLSIWFN